MEVIAFLLPFVLLGMVVIFVAFSGGPSAAREAYRARGTRGFQVVFPIVFIFFGAVVPALVLAAREEAVGGTGALTTAKLTKEEDLGKTLFQQQCKTCHALAATNARGVTGPNLDQIGEVTPQRIETAIKNGGTGQKRMPARLLEGEEAAAVAKYVAKVAGK
jgi:mono/diheme cytochrome c family protein